MICLANALPAFEGHYYSKFLEYSKIPSYWKQAIAYMDDEPHSSVAPRCPAPTSRARTHGATPRPDRTRPHGSRLRGAASLWLRNRALDQTCCTPSTTMCRKAHSMWSTLAPLVRLMGIGDVKVRSDLEGDRYSLVAPADLWRTIGNPTAPGLTAPKGFGKTTKSNSLVFDDFGDLTIPASQQANPPAVAVMHVKNALPIARTEPATSATVVDGDGEGLVDLASAGLLDPTRLLLYSAPYLNDAKQLQTLAQQSTRSWWSPTRIANAGSGGRACTTTSVTPSRRARSPSRSIRSTSASTRSSSSARATRPAPPRCSGAPNLCRPPHTASRYSAYSPGERPAAAFDGDVRTAWTVDDGQAVGKERLVLTLPHPITTDHINLVQFSGRQKQTDPPPKRLISQVGLLFDGSTRSRPTSTARRSPKTVRPFASRSARSASSS